MSYDGTRLYEGLCPTCNVALQREGDRGWCPECEHGYTMRDGEVTLHLRKPQVRAMSFTDADTGFIHEMDVEVLSITPLDKP